VYQSLTAQQLVWDLPLQQTTWRDVSVMSPRTGLGFSRPFFARQLMTRNWFRPSAAVSRFSMARIIRCCLPFAVLAFAIPLLLPPQLAAQLAPYQITVENDHFSYWLPREERTDREYSNGVLMRFPLASVLPIVSVLAGEARPCTGRETSMQPCTSASLSVGQKIYTPTPWRPKAGERPYAGWLFSAIEVERTTSERQRQLGLEVGVTGRPSLGEKIQTVVHERRGHGAPVGWDQQLGFEPAFSVHATESLVLAASPRDAALGALVTGSFTGAVGTLLTGAAAGVEVRAGLRPPHPWRQSAGGRNAAISLYGVGGVTQHAVLRNLMLDGNTFRENSGIQRRPLVTEKTAGVGLRLGRVAVEYRGVVLGREYETQKAAHPYGSLTLSVGH
jgi:lipid A 3-O-deacylase